MQADEGGSEGVCCAATPKASHRSGETPTPANPDAFIPRATTAIVAWTGQYL